jgi:hypothetical protein
MYGNKWQIRMMDAPCKNTGPFCYAFVCLPCSQYTLRTAVLEYEMSRYKCCQGYFDCACFKAGSCGEQNCPECCLCIEAFMCTNFAVSASRALMMVRDLLFGVPCVLLIFFSSCRIHVTSFRILAITELSGLTIAYNSSRASLTLSVFS